MVIQSGVGIAGTLLSAGVMYYSTRGASSNAEYYIKLYYSGGYTEDDIPNIIRAFELNDSKNLLIEINVSRTIEQLNEDLEYLKRVAAKS